jgi:hypothetical protein
LDGAFRTAFLRSPEAREPVMGRPGTEYGSGEIRDGIHEAFSDALIRWRRLRAAKVGCSR